MEMLQSFGLLLGGSFASGVNLYLTVFGLGLADRLQWIELPGNLDVLSNPVVMLVAALLYAVEFFADKIPYVDSAWDSVHTFIRPAGGALLGYLASSGASPAMQFSVAMLAGTVSADAHLTKATARAAINTSPEPISNSVASLTEDITVAGVLFLVIQHPIIASIAVILFVIFSIWFLKVMFRFLKKVFGAIFGSGNKAKTP